MNKKEATILVASLILPGGLVVLGLWKAYELLSKKNKKEKPKEEKDVV